MTLSHAARMALLCTAHDQAIDAGKPSPLTDEQKAFAFAWLYRADDADIDAALSESSATTLHPVMWAASGDAFPVYVAFDAQEAARFAKVENDLHECEVMAVEQVTLVDRYGFPCPRRDAAICAPWLATSRSVDQ